MHPCTAATALQVCPLLQTLLLPLLLLLPLP
jgi:hypothetical protein